MPVLTAAVVSAATGLAEGQDGKRGVCEKAVAVEAPALRDARGHLGAAVYAALGTPPYAAADPYSTDPALVDGLTEADRGALYDEYRQAVARLAFARIAPTVGPLRATDAGGFQRDVGQGDAEAPLLSMADVLRLADRLRADAVSDLSRISAAISSASATDPIEPPVPVWCF